jgi:hypothetical protein
MTHISAKLDLKSFNCPHCGAFAAHTWSTAVECKYKYQSANGVSAPATFILAARVSKCSHCNLSTIWIDDKMVYPVTSTIEAANEDMPQDVKADYEEAKNVIMFSPRGAAALLRLSVQKLCVHLGEKGENVNEDIKKLVVKGLPVTIQQALDVLRVVGNNAVHPGTIDLKDNIETAYSLFSLINLICDNQISQPKRVAAIYSALPQRDRENIEKRDGNA